ncbi:MAG TPA: hypothetical protein VHH35_11160 [Pyrinomonadaceae bacterium]|nr:hypothetical protein [Pyrinomonadaceae bacterium]
MTPEEHNKYLAWSHIGYGGIFFLFMALFLIFFGVMFIGALMAEPTASPIFFFVFVWLFIAVVYAAMTIPAFIAGYGLLKRKKWARTWSIISAVVAAMNFPFGTAITVYTFWFLFSDPGKHLYDQNNTALPPSQTWANRQLDYDSQRQRQGQYNPPLPPPDWR